jgi:hypothetical protein
LISYSNKHSSCITLSKVDFCLRERQIITVDLGRLLKCQSSFQDLEQFSNIKVQILHFFIELSLFFNKILTTLTFFNLAYFLFSLINIELQFWDLNFRIWCRCSLR